uniref:Mitochondrial carrier protein n=1 Tax=Panagrolaimus sp. PS1159 TaxID=55785 RepID=A0AC35FJ70_9BILA
MASADASVTISSTKYQRGSHVDFICGWSAGCIVTVILYPLNKVIFRQQLHAIPSSEAAIQLKSEGIRYLYRGLLPPLMKRTSSTAIMFGMYEKYQNILACKYESDRRKKSFTLCHAQAAAMAGATESLLTPFERVQTLLQSNAYHGKFRNTIEAVKTVSNHGFLEFYRGFHVILFRNAFSNILFFSLRDPFKYAILDKFPTKCERTSYNLFSDFVSGSVLGASLSTLFFPVNVVKTKIQADMGKKYDHFFKVLKDVWIERDYSLKEVYRGAQLNFIRSLLAWGITNATFEYMRKWFT